MLRLKKLHSEIKNQLTFDINKYSFNKIYINRLLTTFFY